LNTAIIIFTVCIILFITDKFKPSTVAMLGCILMICFGVCSPEKALSGFTNDIVLIVFGTEIFGVAFFECGLGGLIASWIIRFSQGKEKRVIVTAGCTAAILSAFLNNQVVCSMMMVICLSISKTTSSIASKNIILPVIICAILGGQCTLIGAPATLIASSMALDSTGNGITMFELLPLGLSIFAAVMLMMYFFSYRKGIEIWGKDDLPADDPDIEPVSCQLDKRKAAVTLFAALVMLVLFISGIVSVGAASVIGALICLLGRAVDKKSSQTD